MPEQEETQQAPRPLESTLPGRLDSARTSIQLRPRLSQPSKHHLPTLDNKHNMDKAKDSMDKGRNSTDRASMDKAKDNLGRASMGKAKANMDKTRHSMGKGSLGKIIRAW